jgi:hypothetical protein
MNITTIERFDERELINKLRHVTMLKDTSVKPYEKASISMERLVVNNLRPSQYYVLQQKLLLIRNLKWELEKHNISIFNLFGFIRLTIEGKNTIDLIPPIVEERIEQNGQITHVICDGMHRLYTAYLDWVIPHVIYIRGVPKKLSYYAYPVPGDSWNKLDIRDNIPEGYIKKWHRTDNNKELFRDFNSVFKNVGTSIGNPSKEQVQV